MTKKEFISTLDFEVAKTAIARKLGIKANELDIKLFRSGDFRIDLKNISGKMSSLFSGSGRALLVTDNLNIKEHKDSFSYEATILLNLKNRSGEYSTKIGKINLDRNRFVFYTMNDLKNRNNKVQKTNEVLNELNDINMSNVESA